MTNKFLLIDGSSLLHRAFFALPPLTTKQGVNTGAVYGFCNMLARLLAEVKPTHIAVAFDKSRQTFRRERYAEYKAQRKPTPSELSEQFPLTMQVLTAMGMQVLELDNYEADDIVGTLATQAPADTEVLVVTGDKDEFQLIKDNVKVYYTRRGITDIQVYDEAEFAKNYEGLKPRQIIELKGLMGDTSDNIPGVPGVGPKTALKLITTYGSVEEVLQHIDEVAGKSLKEKLEQYQEQALLSKELATIYLQAPVATELDKYKVAPLPEAARSLMQELEFRNLWDRLAAVLGTDAPESWSLFAEPVAAERWPRVAVEGQSATQELLQKLATATEPVPLTYVVKGSLPSLELVQLEIAWKEQVYCFTGEALTPAVYSWLANPNCYKVVCEGKELYKACLCHQTALRGVVGDLALAAYLYEAGESSYALPQLAASYLTQHDQGTVQDMPALQLELTKRLEERELVKLYQELELPLVPVLAQMEYYGIAVDRQLLGSITEELRAKVVELEALAQEQAGTPINLKSPKQLGVLLFEHLHLPVVKKTKTGYSTDVSVLEELEGKHPLITTILEHRKLSKLLSTYLEGLEPLLNPQTGRIHTHFQQEVTVTGRLSSTEPNLQNIPTRTEIGKRLREMFVPGAGFACLLSCDYSQVELRVLAHISQDPLFMDAFAHNQDVHARTASEVFGVPLEQVTPQLRTRAKAVNFGIVYGISDYGLSKQLGTTRKEAASYIESYFARYTGIKRYMDSMVEQARAQGYVETLFGRRRYLPNIKNTNFNLRSFAERTAINTPIQGTAADIIKLAMLKVAQALTQQKLQSRLLLQVHDELVLEVTEAELATVSQLVQQTMEQAVQLTVPLLAEVKTGKNWAEAK